ncbi:MAG: carboxylating nicotinate-nucleotide diphosphorylase [Gammaproteobacteria bacterium]
MLRDYKPDLKKVSISIANALEEDIGLGDVTGELINANLSIQAKLICREETVLCGTQWFTEAFKQLDPNISIKWNKQEGDLISANTELALLKGNAKCMVASERTGLNFLQMMSGIAYKTHKYVSSLSGSNTKLLDTRKTLPGLRYEQKYSVLVGGGENHRMGLYDAALVKENHIASAGSIENAVNSLKSKGIQLIEVEVENLHQLDEVINSGANIAMLDNFDDDNLNKASEIARGKIKLEVSGNIDLSQINKLKKLNIDYISSGDLTKNISATDYSLIFEKID